MKFNKTAMLGTATVLASTLLGTGTAFAASAYDPDPAQTETPVSTTLELPDNGGTNPVPTDPVNPDKPDSPDGGSNPDGNKPNNPDGPFGIAYQPGAFNTETTTLKENGPQSIDFKSTDPHVAVKDKARLTRGWTLKANLKWTDKQLPGATIKTSNGQGEVKINEGNNTASKLVTQTGSEVSGTKALVINDQDTDVMTAKGAAKKNDVFDYGLGKTTLEIADAGSVEAGTYTGNVTWTLAATA